MNIPSERASREIRSGRMNRRPPSFVVTLVALAIVFALAWTFFTRSGPSVSAPVVSGIQGTYTWQTAGDALAQDGAFGAVAGGNAGGKAALPPGTTSFGGSRPASAYDAVGRTETTLGRTGRSESVTKTIGAWPPVWRLATHSPLDYQGLAAIVRTAVEDGDHTVGIKPLKEGDRAVWRAAMTLDGKLIDLVVDQQTGIVTWYSDGGDTFTANVDWASPPPADTTYTAEVPAGTKVKTVTDQVVYVGSPAAAGRIAGFDPLVSGLAPDGYALKSVAAWKADPSEALRWVDEGISKQPRARPRVPLVAQLYTRGLSWFTMEQLGPEAMRSVGGGLRAGLDGAARRKASYQQTTLQYGAFRGATASTWYQESGPSLLVAVGRRAVFVTGSLTRQELVAFAEGLKPATANPSR